MIFSRCHQRPKLESPVDSIHYRTQAAEMRKLEVEISQWYHLPVETLLFEIKLTFLSFPGSFISPLPRATNR